MGRHLAVLFSDLQRQSDAWLRVPRERMVAAIAEYRYLAESLAGQYGCLYREWAGDGHMFLFESPDAAAQFGLRLIENWQIANRELAALRDGPELPLRLGCHFGECTRLDGEEAWIGRANANADEVRAAWANASPAAKEFAAFVTPLPSLISFALSVATLPWSAVTFA